MYEYETSQDFKEAFNEKQLVEHSYFDWYKGIEGTLTPCAFLIKIMKREKMWDKVAKATA